MDVKKTIAELTSQLSEINYDSDEDNVLLNDADGAQNQSTLDENHLSNVEPSKLRKTTDRIALPATVYGGKKTTRKKTYSSSEISDIEESQSISAESSDQSEEDGESVLEDEAGSSEMEEGDMASPRSVENGKKETKTLEIYSARSKSIPSDVKKGTAIRNQLRIWESLLECRIKLQKGLSSCNNLPPKEDLAEIKGQLDTEGQSKLNRCKKNLLIVLEKLVDLQKELLKQCSEYKKTKKTKDSISNETDEIPSDESEIESDIDRGIDDDSEKEAGQPPKKKRRLNDYASIIKESYEQFVPFRNTSIQKWNDKTKVSTGKMANSNFSAFDQSTLKQIEQIMADKSRLINRTRIKRQENIKNPKNQNGLTQDSQEVSLDAEIFDDTDFYHKLLRDYIERKSVDAVNSSHTERQLIELQKLRSKMKKSVDTKSTKGRKLRYVVMPKLVNFMAPRPYNTWSEEAETELYNSLFGRIKVL